MAPMRTVFDRAISLGLPRTGILMQEPVRLKRIHKRHSYHAVAMTRSEDRIYLTLSLSTVQH